MFDIVLTSDLLSQGYSADEVRGLLRSGELQRVRRGAYERARSGLSIEEQHRRLIEAALSQHDRDVVVSHLSAAVLHGLAVWPEALRLVHLTRPRSGGGKVRAGVELHASALPDAQVTARDGILLTTPARTVVDLCRTLPLDQAVAAGDGALRRGVARSEREEVLLTCRGWPGIGNARRAVALLDGRAESAGESVSRVRMHEARLPAPVPQYEVHDRRGRLVGRADFGWEEQRVLGEFDGRVKYGRLLKPGQQVEEGVYREKLREDALRDLDWRVVRWTWADLYPGDVLVERLGRVLA